MNGQFLKERLRTSFNALKGQLKTHLFKKEYP